MFTAAATPAPCALRACVRAPYRRRGYTLVEVMIGFVIMAIALLGMISGMLHAYRLNTKARLHDAGRAVLRTFVDQFQRIGTGRDGTNLLLFTHTVDSAGVPQFTSLGLRTDRISDDISGAGYPVDYRCEVPIGPTGHTVTAVVRRKVYFLNMTTGARNNPPSTRDSSSYNYMLEAQFELEYTPYPGARSVSQVMTAVRAVP